MSNPVEAFFRSRRTLPEELIEAQRHIEGVARAHGLQFVDTIFEMCDYQEINMLAAYGGFPTRYPHWRWGMEYLQMQRGYEYGLQKIYEMVINTDPSYAYLLDNNTFMDQKLVMAHVYGHVDFFTNNAWFAPTDRRMLDRMANHAARIRKYQDTHGEATVESFIDTCLSVENLVDPYQHHIRRQSAPESPQPQAAESVPKLKSDRRYMDRYINPPEALAEEAQARADLASADVPFPVDPVRDVLGFIQEHGHLQPWQQDVLGIIRAEALYFAPQAQTKIMNEGWASYWHTHLMTQHLLEDSEVIDYCDHHSGTTASAPGQFNPYKVGLALYRHIEERWDKGRHGKAWLDCDDGARRDRWDTGAGKGRDKIFEVRRTHNDVTFIDTFVTTEFVEANGLFTTRYDQRAGKWVVDSRELHEVKQRLLFMLTNRGQPQIRITNANHANRGELELTHAHEGVDIEIAWAEPTMANLARLWGRPVHLLTRVDDREVTLHHDGETFTNDGLRKGRKTGAG